MKIRYECEHCHEQFDCEKKCRAHEASHLDDIERVKYLIQHFLNDDVCAHCAHVFYVYGCEQDCMFGDCGPSNNYKDFVEAVKK